MLTLGTVLNIDPLNEESLEKYTCKIMDFEDDFILIDYPRHIETRKTLFLINGKQIKVNFVDQDGNAFKFTSFVIGRKKQTIPLLMITKPSDNEIVKIQRREFVRIKWSVDVAVHSKDDDFQPFVTMTDDISAGGASILVNKNKPLFKNQEILCWFVLASPTNKYRYLKFNCKVVRLNELNETTNNVSLQFLNKTNSDVQKITQFCYETQVFIKQKERGLEYNL